jgi:hypothetical protein
MGRVEWHRPSIDATNRAHDETYQGRLDRLDCEAEAHVRERTDRRLGDVEGEP